MLAGEFDRFPAPDQALFRMNPEANRTYLLLAQNLSRGD